MSFFVLEIFTYLYYANEKSDDVIGGPKTVQHSIKNTCISRNIRAVFFNLGIRNVHHKRTKVTPLMPSPLKQLLYVAGSILIKTKIPRFYLKQGSSNPSNLMGRVNPLTPGDFWTFWTLLAWM